MKDVFRNFFCISLLSVLIFAGCQVKQQANTLNGTGDSNLNTSAILECDPLGVEFGGGSGTPSQPYRICSNSHLIHVANCLNCHFKLFRSLDMSNTPFTPIGGTAGFTGTFDGSSGSGFQISNLSVTGQDLLGLFSLTTGTAVLKNINLSKVTLSGRSQVGALVGALDGYSSVVNCTSSGNVTGDPTLGFEVGGLVGVMRSLGSISDSSSSAMVSGSQWVGGLVGQSSLIGQISKGAGSIIHSHATGNVSSTFGAAGGLIGVAYYGLQISTSYATGNVTSNAAAVGGLIGLLAGYGPVTTSVTDSFSTGSVTVGSDTSARYSTTKNYAGGSLVGSMETPPINIARSFGVGKISGGTAALNGGLAGVCVYGGSVSCVTATNSYWDMTTTTLATSPVGTGMNTSSMQNLVTYSGWDFAKVWNPPGAGKYPTLR